LPAQHPLVRCAGAALEHSARDSMDSIGGPLYARRCIYRRNKGVLLVTEVFLPAIAGISEKTADSRINEFHKQSIE
jgi:chorismate--pyruvate lyase